MLLTREALPPAGIDYIAESVDPDEPAFLLVEMNLLPENFVGIHRYQLIYVVRADKLAVWPRILGTADEHRYPELRLAGGVIDGDQVYIEETVGRLMDIADQWRADAKLYTDLVVEQQQSSTLIQDFVDQYEDASKWLKRESQFGPKYRRQRG